ncbi:MAG: hypothetical protein KBC02_03395 [Candidatus Pacebacteria bacterium]|nr:hypothetical protein [Candidatus Paceibacterota bacterium]
MDEVKKCAQCDGVEFAEGKCVGCGADEVAVAAPATEEATVDAPAAEETPAE